MKTTVSRLDKPAALSKQTFRAAASAFALKRAAAMGLAEATVTFVEQGSHTPVILVRAGDRGIVVKCFPSVDRFLRVVRAHRHLERHGVPAPRLLEVHYAARLRPGMWRYVLVEELLAEGSLSRQPPEVCGGAGALFGRLHANARGLRGDLLLPRPGPYAPAYTGRVLERLSDLAGSELLTAQERAQIETWFRLEARRIAALGRSNELIHGRVGKPNVLRSPAHGGYALIDFLNVHYGHFGRDLVRATHRIACDSETIWSGFLSAYLATPGLAIDQARLLDEVPFFHADLHLAEARRRHSRRQGNAVARNLAALRSIIAREDPQEAGLLRYCRCATLD